MGYEVEYDKDVHAIESANTFLSIRIASNKQNKHILNLKSIYEKFAA